MAQGMSMSWVVIAAISVMLVQGVVSKKLSVGDGKWTIPSSPDFYATWASKQSFAVDDVLVFDIVGAHTVAEVDKDAYESCTAPSGAKILSTTTEVPLSKEGNYYFICTAPGHCAKGQKLAVTVPSTATTPATPTPGTPSSHDAPPPGNGSPLGISAFPVSFLAIVISFVVLAKVIA